MATNSGWDRNIPSGTSSIAQGDDAIRSTRSFMQAWWEDEHYGTDGSSGSAGVHKLGSARVFTMTATSQLSNPTGDNSGRVAWESSGNGLWVADGSNSTWTLVTNGITLGSEQTWTATQRFSSGVSTSDLTVDNSINGVLSGSTYTFLTSVGVGGSYSFPVTITGARPGDFCVVSVTSARAQAAGEMPDISSQVTWNDVVEVNIRNDTASTWSLASDETISVLVFGNPDRA